jgi:hypothetical protein
MVMHVHVVHIQDFFPEGLWNSVGCVQTQQQSKERNKPT